jgi:uncharacterized membrane protein
MENQTLGYRLNKNWFIIFSIGYGLLVGLPFLAPVLMHLEAPKAAGLIYSVYKFLCHQFPQRSFFLFGEKTMYTLPEIFNAWQPTNNPLILRKFVGTPQMGWKVAWSDRMISMYSSVLFAAWIWYPFRKKIKIVPWWGFMIFLLPMVVDGVTHMISDFSGIGQGFRDSNLWLAELTNFKFVAAFYAGDALGSFNSWMRLFSGIMFGVGAVLFAFPYIAEIFESDAEKYEIQQQQLTQLKDKALQEITNLSKNQQKGNQP